MAETVVERATVVLAGFTRYGQHGQRCPVWTQRPKGVIPYDQRTPTQAELARCDCWVANLARSRATALGLAGLLAEPSPEAATTQTERRCSSHEEHWRCAECAPTEPPDANDTAEDR